MRAWTKPDEIASIEYYMPFGDWEEVGDAPKWDPRNRDTADHSIPYVLARNLISGESYLDAFTLDKLPFRDPVVKELIDKITLSARCGVARERHGAHHHSQEIRRGKILGHA